MSANYIAIKKAIQNDKLSEHEVKEQAANLYLRNVKNSSRIKDNEYNISGFNDSVELKENIQEMLNDEIIDLNILEDGTLKAFVICSEQIKFTQPFSKQESEYMSYEEVIKNSPSTKQCGSCTHFVPMFGIPVGESFEKHLCHLVRGFVDDLGTCKYSSRSLIEESKEEKESKANRINRSKEMRKA